MLDVLIVGSGPAGLSAAVYTSRAGFSTRILGGKTLGGMLKSTEKVENYLGLRSATGNELADVFLAHAQDFGAELTSASVDSIEKHGSYFTVKTTTGEVLEARAVIYSAGSEPRKLSVVGETSEGVSYCATCDGAFFTDSPVVVVGGGETAVEDALYLSAVASEVTVLVRSEWRATPPAVAKLMEQTNVRILMGETVASIEADEDELVTGVLTESGKLIEAEGVFIAAGQIPNSSEAGDFVSVYSDGFIEDSTVAGFFVAGDVSDPEYRQVVIAAGDGAKAGIDATRYLLSN